MDNAKGPALARPFVLESACVALFRFSPAN